jgi:rod shape-determining protein MreC
MQRIIAFILRNKIGLLYLVLLFIALLLTAQNNAFHRARYFNSANWISGNLYEFSFSISTYFDLKSENTKLQEENRQLRRQLFNAKIKPLIDLDTAMLDYQVYEAQIIKNNFSAANNYITINRGRDDGIGQDMGVITSKGILGILEHSSPKFSTVQSILNTKSNINAKIANTDYFGSLTWNRKDYRFVQLEDIPRLVPLKVGDTIVTGAMSSIFPENIPIGTIESFDLSPSQSFYDIDVRLFNDMTNLKQVYVIWNKYRDEVLKLESEIDVE